MAPALPTLSVADIAAAIPGVQDIGQPTRGGQKVVFPCVIAGQRCALKVMLANPSLPQGPPTGDDREEEYDEITARARREVETMLRCNTPHLVRLGPLPLTRAEIGGQQVLYFAEEWIEGPDLRSIIRDAGPLSVADTLRLGTNVTEAIKTLWSLSKVHRDIKPGNIMRRNSTGEFVLLDMGFVLALDEESLTVSGIIPGTPIYFSPEQTELSRKRQMDFRSDLFSLGVVMYESITGHHPFWTPGMSLEDAIARMRTVDPEAPCHCRQAVPQGLSSIILRLLAKQPHRRFRSCDSLISSLNATE
jgi:serine/threonine-protein kinase